MNGPIGMGDLVYVYRWPHHHGGIIGYHFVVAVLADFTFCPVCRECFIEPSAGSKPGWAVPNSWLRRVPPLSELERSASWVGLDISAKRDRVFIPTVEIP